MQTRPERLDWRDERATTIVELMIVAGFLGLIMLGTVLLWAKTQEAYFDGSEAAELQGNLRVALDQIAHDVRRAGRDLTNAGLDPIPTATATGLRVRMDLDDNGAIAASSEEDVTYAFDATGKRVTRNGQTLAESIGNLAFTYWWSPPVGSGCGAGALQSGIPTDTGGSTGTTADQKRHCIRRVTVALTGQTVIGGQTLSRTSQTDVDIRAR